MDSRSRREFLADVGRGMLVASLGAATAMELGLAPAFAEEPGRRLTFGRIEPLVSFMQEAPPERLLPALVDKLKAGTDLKALVSAAALANARAFGGQDYTGSLIVGAFHTAGQTDRVTKEPYPYADQLDSIREKDANLLLAQAEEAIQANDQARACAVVHRYGEFGLPARPVFDLLVKYAVSEDGALHAEKYYRTVSDEFAASRLAFRWRHLVALARVTASEHGFPAPGYQEACDLLGVS